MPADVRIQRFVGSSPVGTDVTGLNVRATAADLVTTDDIDFPVKIPASGTNYSYWVSLRLVTVTSPNGVINNIRWYTDGGNGLGSGVGMVVARARNGANAGYRQATGVLAQSGLQLSQANHSGLVEEPVDAFTYTSGSPLVVAGAQAGVGAFGDYVVTQITVAAGVVPHTPTPETMWFQYDET